LSTDTLRLSDKVLLALIGLLSYFALSGTLAPMGLLIEPLAREFEMTASEAARVLSGFTSGNLLGALLALFILGKVPYRLLVLSLYGSAGCVLALLPFSHQTSTIWALLALLGVAFGIGLATAAQLIALIYRDDQRAALLVATDSSFSLAGTVMASLTVFLLIRPIAGLPLWLSPYIAIFCVALLIMLLALIVRYPQGSSSPGDWGWIKRTPKPIWGAAGAL
jgi:TsgA-like MFS transporter